MSETMLFKATSRPTHVSSSLVDVDFSSAPLCCVADFTSVLCVQSVLCALIETIALGEDTLKAAEGSAWNGVQQASLPGWTRSCHATWMRRCRWAARPWSCPSRLWGPWQSPPGAKGLLVWAHACCSITPRMFQTWRSVTWPTPHVRGVPWSECMLGSARMSSYGTMQK